ncbi:hypothetical protein ACWPKO_08710 [Coraliomargarita sp. W4R53]
MSTSTQPAGTHRALGDYIQSELIKDAASAASLQSRTILRSDVTLVASTNPTWKTPLARHRSTSIGVIPGSVFLPKM